MRVTSGVVVKSAVGPCLIVVSFAGDHDLAGNRRWRTIGRAHACHRGKKTWTVIRHARELGFARAPVALAITMVEPPLRRPLVSGSGSSLRLRPRRRLARRSAVPLPAVAGAAHPEQDLALPTCASLHTNPVAVVHRILLRERETCSGPRRRASCAQSRRPSAEGLGRLIRGPRSFS